LVGKTKTAYQPPSAPLAILFYRKKRGKSGGATGEGVSQNLESEEVVEYVKGLPRRKGTTLKLNLKASWLHPCGPFIERKQSLGGKTSNEGTVPGTTKSVPEER